MSRALHRASVALAAVAVAAGGALVASPAQAATVEVRQADLIAPTDTADGGVMEFLAQGVHLKTTNGTGYARAHFKVGVPLAQVTKVEYTWYGTDFAPGVYYDVDVDGDGKVDGQFIGELAYGGQDVWLNRDTQDFPESALPDNYFANVAPCTGAVPAGGVTDPCGSSGASKHGTLANWATRLQAASGKAPQLFSGGFLLNGAPGNGVLTQVTYGPNTYSFTNQAKDRVDVTASAKRIEIRKSQKAKIVGDVDPVGPGAKITLQVKKGGKWTDVKVRNVAADGKFQLGAKAVKLGINRFRVTISETNSTAPAKSRTVKVKVTK